MDSTWVIVGAFLIIVLLPVYIMFSPKRHAVLSGATQGISEFMVNNLCLTFIILASFATTLFLWL